MSDQSNLSFSELHVGIDCPHLAQVFPQSYAQLRFDIYSFRSYPSNPLIICDGSPIHRSQVTKGFLISGAAERMPLECLPDHAPDLNPDGGNRNYLGRVQLENVCCRDLAQLRIESRQAIERLRHKKTSLRLVSSLLDTLGHPHSGH